MIRPAFGASVLLVVLLVACERRDRQPGSAASSVASSTGADDRAAAAPSVSTPALPLKAGNLVECRALRVEGTVEQGGVPVAPAAPLSGPEWLNLSDGARVTVKYQPSGREITLVGPARARPCPSGEELLVLAEGTVRSAGKAGATPGAEFTIASPAALIVFPDAELELKARGWRGELRVLAGQVSVQGAAGGSIRHVQPSGSALKLRETSQKPEEYVVHCEQAANESAALAGALLANKPDATFGDKARRHYSLRRAARLSCARAVAVLGATPELARDTLAKRLHSADQSWRSVPHQRAAR